MTLTNYTELEQGSDEWLAARRGIVTASVIGALITPTLKVADNETSRGLTLTLTAERITGHVEPVFVSNAMLRGQMDEPLARAWYAEHHAPVTETGFMVEDKWGFPIGYSPDGLVEEGNGLIEVKSRDPKIHLKTILEGKPPRENLAQMQTGMLVTGRPWCDYVSWAGGMCPYVVRVHADPAWADVLVDAAMALEHNIATNIQTYEATTAGIEPTERIDHFQEASL